MKALRAEEAKHTLKFQKQARNTLKFQKHVNTLVWKSYLQRIRKWRLLTAEVLISLAFFLTAVFVAKPVFLTPLQDEPEPPLASADLLQSIHASTVIGYAPQGEPYATVMERVSDMLNIQLLSAKSIDDLNVMIYNRAKGEKIIAKVIWVIFESHEKNRWKFSICSTEMARFALDARQSERSYNQHLRAGFLAVQLSISQVILETSSQLFPQYELSLVAMPVSPLMEEDKVRKVISLILLCFTLALLPPIMETVYMVVQESKRGLKRALRIQGVSYAAIYVGWLSYAFLTAFPVCLMGSLTLILIFRWIHLLYVLVMLLCYFGVMMVMSFIMSMYHSKAYIACIWSMLFHLMQTFLAEMIVHHRYDEKHSVLTFVIHVIVPTMGLVHGFNHFALLQTGKDSKGPDILVLIGTWLVVSLIYFRLLMALQHTIGNDMAIGGQMPWRSVLFSTPKDKSRIRRIEAPTGFERAKLQEVDELVAKAISFRNVSKSIMGVPMVSHVTFDIYRGEFTNIYSQRVQEKMMGTIEDLLTGLTYPDSGTINVLGVHMIPGRNLMTEPHMLSYCHRSSVLITEFTVEEHFIFFASLSLWSEPNDFVSEFSHMRMRHLLPDGHLEPFVEKRVERLDIFYRAQLCWALALLLEPRIVIMPNFTDEPNFMSVMKDKIVTYRKYVTIIKLCFSTSHLEFADRVFLFDQKFLCFGGTPAFMYFTYGREYRVRLSFRAGSNMEFGKTEASVELLDLAKDAGATVRAYLGSLLILKLPTSPTNKVAEFVQQLAINNERFGIVSMNISLPDSEEVCNRCITESRMYVHDEHDLDEHATTRLAEPRTWKRQIPKCLFSCIQLRRIGWKYCRFYCAYKTALIVTLISASLAGVFIGLLLSSQLLDLYKNHDAKRLLHGELLTVEALQQKTLLVLRLEDTPEPKSVANAYVLSATNATAAQVANIAYTALLNTESLTEYLVTRAIDSPQKYVFLYAYGMDVGTNPDNGKLVVQALYSPLHKDSSASARSLARVYTSLLRHFTGDMGAGIEIIDNPLLLDLTHWMKTASSPPLTIQFILILTISHITLLPSKEYGLIRHLQKNALAFSPASYWFSLFFWDMVMYMVLVALASGVMVLIICLAVPITYFNLFDLAVIPWVLLIYGIGCIPQAYLFSLGPRPALNSMAFMIFNIVFGETTVLAKFYADKVGVMNFMLCSPQLNIAYALVKINKIFLYNSECIIFRNKKLCSSKMLHKCCQKCGVLQKCFEKQSYMSTEHGILLEVLAMLVNAVVLTIILFLWEYNIILRLWYILMRHLYATKTFTVSSTTVSESTNKERAEVEAKLKQMKSRHAAKLKKSVIPWVLLIYGIGCIPQAYLFSLGPRPALNSMAFMIFNIVFGETTVLAKFYADKVGVMNFMLCSPQLNIAYALVKINKIFLYNSECIIFRNKKLCSSKMLHKCCQKCGVLQKCFEKQSYMSTEHGILLEVLAMLVNAVVLTIILFLWEYNIILRLWYILMRHLYATKTFTVSSTTVSESTNKERAEVEAKLKQMKSRHAAKLKKYNNVDTFGEYLLVDNLTKNVAGVYNLVGVSFGLGKGEALAVSGLKRHGRLMLCEVLSGYRLPTEGNAWAMSQWDLKDQPSHYARNVSLSSEEKSLPDWLTAKETLDLIGVLRGVPVSHLRREIKDIIALLDLKRKANHVVSTLEDRDRKKLRFAAAVIGAPPILILDECVAHQKYSVRRAMYYILYQMRRKGHAMLVSSSNVENHMPVTNRLAVLLDGRIMDVDHVDVLCERYGNQGFTVVVHLKDEVDVHRMFSRYFQQFVINDTSEVLVNVQVLDPHLTWSGIFSLMETLKSENQQVYSYIVTSVPLDYIYNTILSHEVGLKVGGDLLSYPRLRQILEGKKKNRPTEQMLRNLKTFETKYAITALKELPWSVIFNR